MRRPQREKSKTLLMGIVAVLVGGVFFVSLTYAAVSKGPMDAKDKLAPGTVAKTVSQNEESYVYNPVGKPDPFKSFIAKQEAYEKKRKKKKPRTYLETLELSQLDLIAIVISPKGNWAMVRDSKGVGHVIKKGTAIGTNEGVVYKITPDKVIIRERHMDFRGKEVVKEIVKKLHASNKL